METRAAEAYEYPLLIKSILQSPIGDYPSREVVYRGERRFTYAQFRERVARLASALVGLGIKAGDTVAVMDWDSNRYLECYFAVPMIGAVLHTINIRLSPEQLTYTIDHADDSLIFVNAEFLPLVEAIRSRLDKVKQYVLMTDTDAAPGTTIRFAGEYEDLLSHAKPMREFPDFDENTRATTFYTTGTTGLPKGVYFSHRQLVLHTLATTASLASTSEGRNFSRDDVYMPLTPMYHVHAWGLPYVATMLGMKQVYPGKYIPAKLLELIGKEKVTVSHCVPTILMMLLRDPGSASVDFKGWKIVIGGSALPKALCLEAMARGIDIRSGYGMSETSPVIALSHLAPELYAADDEIQAEHRTRSGYPIALVQARVVDPQGREQPWDNHSAGELVLRSPWLTQGYLKDQPNSDKLWAGGWLHTQDVAIRDSSGAIKITDRLKDVIKVGGEWLSSLELEDLFLTHPAVAEAAVIGRADEKWGEIPLVVIVLRPGKSASAEDLQTHLAGFIDRGIMPRYAKETQVAFAPAIPKTSVGKIDKLALRSTFA
ncbi:MAG TPA: fatty acid--CoA ligase [Rectinemataceae bacterium]|nr:fatty acid--CoA ligase [Rectinemataceae bacterium]